MPVMIKQGDHLKQNINSLQEINEVAYGERNPPFLPSSTLIATSFLFLGGILLRRF